MNNRSNAKCAPFINLWTALIVIIVIILGTFSSIFSVVALLLSIVAIFSMSEENAICFLTLIMPFANIFKSSPGAQSFFTYLLLFFVIFRLFKRGKIDSGFLLSFLILVVFMFAQSLISFNAFRLIKFLANILFVYLVTNANMQNGNKNLYISYVFGTALSSLTAALKIIPNQAIYVGLKESSVGYESFARFAGLYSDPNYYSVNLIVALCLIVILYHRKQLGTVPALLLTALMVSFAVMTISKSAFLMLILPLLLLLYSKIKKRKHFTFVALLVICIFLVINILSGKIDILDTILKRFEANDITTGRADLWKKYVDYLKSNPLQLIFGVGFGGDLVGDKAAHNTYIDIFYYLGMLGIIPLIAVFSAITKKEKSVGQRNFLNYSVIICVMVMYFFLSQLFYFDWAFHIIIAILVSRMNMGQGSKG